MKNRHKRICFILALMLVLCLLPGHNSSAAETEAKDITAELKVTFSGGQSSANVKDNKITTRVIVGADSTVTLSSEKAFSQVYIMWNKIPGEWTGTIAGKSTTYGTHGFLHEYLSVEETKEMILTLPKGGQITDIYAFTAGELPSWVQVWEDPWEEADLLLFTTHSDDEQLFFSGLLPYYAVVREANVQVIYGTNHWDSNARPHEQLNGLWTVGIRHYPVISEFPDDARSLGSTDETVNTVLARAKKVYNQDDWVRFQVQMLRRFKAQVAVIHDFAGEYRHGAHILNADSMKQAITLSGDASFDPDSAEKYGTWEVKKVYSHLYAENPIVMEAYDVPSDKLDGLTPFQVSKKGYACHDSQQYTWFTRWLNQDSAADIATYNPREFGLFFTSVGEDVEKNDMMEHLSRWKDIHAKEEAERLAKEEAERRTKEEEARRAEEEAEAKRKKEQQKKTMTIVLVAVLAVVAVIVLYLLWRRKKRKEAARRRARKRQLEKRREAKR